MHKATVVFAVLTLLAGGAWLAGPKVVTQTKEVEVPVYLNTTLYENRTETVYVESPPPTTPPHDPGPPPPRHIFVREPPKYVYGNDVVAHGGLSTTPFEDTPWTGTTPPHVNLHYRHPNSIDLDYTGFLHNAWAYIYGYVGYQICDNPIIRYWNFTSADNPDGPGHDYASLPTAEDWQQYTGLGENCYARAFAASAWGWMACVEFDGSLTPRYEEEHPDLNEIHTHVDHMDACFGEGYKVYP